MDNSEVHYLTYDPEEILLEMHTAYVEAGGDVLYPGDEKEMLLRAAQAIMVQAFAGVDNALRMATLRYAVGDYLDIYGENRGCERIRAAAAQAFAEISFRETGRRETFQAGTALTADGDMIWRLTDDIEHSGVQQTITVQIEAEEPGSAGNMLKAGTQMQMMSGSAAIESVYCNMDASGGNDEETDDAYRERIREYGLASATTGPKVRYESTAKRVSSKVADARALQISGGNVGVYLIVSGSETQAVVDAVQAALNDETERPLTDYVSVSIAEERPYLLDVQYIYEGEEDISEAVSQAVNGYKEWQEGTIGRPFNPDRLTVALYEAGCTRVIIKPNSSFDGGTVQYTEIEPSQVCKGTVAVEEARA